MERPQLPSRSQRRDVLESAPATVPTALCSRTCQPPTDPVPVTSSSPRLLEDAVMSSLPAASSQRWLQPGPRPAVWPESRSSGATALPPPSSSACSAHAQFTAPTLVSWATRPGPPSRPVNEGGFCWAWGAGLPLQSFLVSKTHRLLASQHPGTSHAGVLDATAVRLPPPQ